MNMFLAALLFILGIVLVIKGGDWFVDASSFIARAANIPSFIVGATIVSFATTMPELLVSVMASLEGKNDMAVGNAVGSVTANTGLIMGLAIVFMTIVTPRVSYLKQCIILVVAGAILYIGSLSGTLAPWAGTVLIIVFIIFINPTCSILRIFCSLLMFYIFECLFNFFYCFFFVFFSNPSWN